MHGTVKLSLLASSLENIAMKFIPKITSVDVFLPKLSANVFNWFAAQFSRETSLGLVSGALGQKTCKTVFKLLEVGVSQWLFTGAGFQAPSSFTVMLDLSAVLIFCHFKSTMCRTTGRFKFLEVTHILHISK